MVKYVVGFSAERKPLAFKLPEGHFESALHREVPVLETWHLDAATADCSRIRTAGGRRTIARRIELALARIHDNRAVVEYRAVTIYIHSQERCAGKTRLRGGCSGDCPIPSNGLHDSHHHVRGIVNVGQIPNVGRYQAVPHVKRRWTSIALLAKGVLRKIIAEGRRRVTANWSEYIRAVID